MDPGREVSPAVLKQGGLNPGLLVLQLGCVLLPPVLPLGFVHFLESHWGLEAGSKRRDGLSGKTTAHQHIQHGPHSLVLPLEEVFILERRALKTNVICCHMIVSLSAEFFLFLITNATFSLESVRCTDPRFCRLPLGGDASSGTEKWNKPSRSRPSLLWSRWLSSPATAGADTEPLQAGLTCRTRGPRPQFGR